MAMHAVQTEEAAGNRKLTDPREAYSAMRELVAETESELGRIHGELDVMIQAWKALTWNDYEFDVDAWHRLMARTVAKVETLRAHVEAEDFERHLHPTEEERTEAARKDKVVDMMLKGAKAAVGGKLDVLDKIVVGMAAAASEVDAMDEKSKLKVFELFGSMVDAAIAERAKA